MCGRFSLKSTIKAIEDEFSIDSCEIIITPRYNIAPSQNVAVVISENGKNTLKEFRWGLIPSWAKDINIGYRMINARSETINQKISYKNALKNRRCLIIADGFYEWKAVDDPRYKGNKIPYYFYLNGQKPFAFAGLWDTWKSHENQIINSCTMITTSPNQVVAEIHNRMPVILQKNIIPAWLDTDIHNENKLSEWLKPYPPEEFKCHDVSKYVNSPVNDSPKCIVPAK